MTGGYACVIGCSNCRAGLGLIASAIFNTSSKGIDVLLRPAFKMAKHTHKTRARNVVV